MNLKIWMLTLFGVLMGLASVFGYTQSNEWLYWLVIAVISGFVIAKVTDRQIFVKSVVVGLFMGIFTGVIQSVLFDKYLENNPQSLDGFKEIPLSLAPQFVVLFTGPFIGIVFGLFIGLIAIIIDKITGKELKDAS